MCCGKHESDVGPISWNGNCLTCATALLEENVTGIAEKSGYAFRRQLSGMERYVQKARAAMQGEERVDA
jgi:hypothetical protein